MMKFISEIIEEPEKNACLAHRSNIPTTQNKRNNYQKN